MKTGSVVAAVALPATGCTPIGAAAPAPRPSVTCAQRAIRVSAGAGMRLRPPRVPLGPVDPFC